MQDSNLLRNIPDSIQAVALIHALAGNTSKGEAPGDKYVDINHLKRVEPQIIPDYPLRCEAARSELLPLPQSCCEPRSQLANCKSYPDILRHEYGIRIRPLSLSHHHHDLPAKTLLVEAKSAERLPDEIRPFFGVTNEVRVESEPFH